MPTKKQLSKVWEQENEFPETRRIDDPLYKSPAIPKQKVDDTEVWDEVSDRICDILFESNGFSSGADMIINDLKKHFTITRK